MRIDIALGGGTATARVVVGRVVHRASVPFTMPAEAEGTASTIAATLQALAAAIAHASGRPVEAPIARVVLLPPLSDVRLIPLPPLRPAEAMLVIRRDASRYFLGDAGARTIGIDPATRESGRPLLAASTATSLAEAIRTACGFAGWTLDSIVPAHASWIAASGESSKGGPGPHAVLAVHERAVHVIRIENGQVAAVRRVPVSAPADAAAAAGAAPGTATVFAARQDRDALVHAISSAGWMVAAGTPEPLTAEDAAVAGAANAVIELVPPTLEAQRRRARGSTAFRLAAVGVLLVILAAAVELWGARHELRTVRERRAAIHEEVAPLLASRDSIARLGEQSQRIEQLESAAPRWTRALFDLALLLPQDTWVNALRTSGDTIVVEATGSRASSALQALRKAGSLKDIRLLGAVARELEAGETATERFQFTAVLTHPVDADVVPSPDGSTPMRAERTQEAAEKPARSGKMQP